MVTTAPPRQLTIFFESANRANDTVISWAKKCQQTMLDKWGCYFITLRNIGTSSYVNPSEGGR